MQCGPTRRARAQRLNYITSSLQDSITRTRLRPVNDALAQLTRVVTEIAASCCQGRVISVLEGGYDLTALSASVEVHLRVLLEGA